MSSRPTPAVGLVATALILAGLAGCLGDDQTPPPTSQPAATGNATPTEPPARAVVADIGPGTNPYHEAFRRPTWQTPPHEVVEGMPEATPLNLTLGDGYEDSRAADEDLWSNYDNRTLYWVPGTNLLLYTDRPWDWLPDGSDGNLHGAGTTHAVEKACQQCYVLAYVDARSQDGHPTRFIAEKMPWVDVVTSTNVPGDYTRNLREGSYAEATHQLFESGRLQFTFSGNVPVAGGGPPPFPHVSLPPWAVMVGGAHSECNAVEANAGKPADFVGNYSQRLADTGTVNGTTRLVGTSFSTPQLAGTYASALIQVRRSLPADTHQRRTLWSGPPQQGPSLDDGNLTHLELLEALKHAARYFEPSAYEPCRVGPFSTAAPVSPTPWVEMGWGYVGPPEADQAARIVLGETEPEPIPDRAQAWMDAQREARQVPYDTVWDDADEAS